MAWTKSKPKCVCYCSVPGAIVEYANVYYNADDEAYGRALDFPDYGYTNVVFDGDYTTGAGSSAVSLVSVDAATEAVFDINFQRCKIRVSCISNGLPVKVRTRRVEANQNYGGSLFDFTILEENIATGAGADGETIVLFEEEIELPVAPEPDLENFHVQVNYAFLEGPALSLPFTFDVTDQRLRTITKVGFAPYRQDGGEVPTIYRTETTSGALSGHRHFTTDTIPEFPGFTQDLETSGAASPYDSPPAPDYLPTQERFTDTPTTRTVPTPDGALTLTLSDEYTTAELGAVLDPIAEAAATDYIGLSVSVQALTFLDSNEFSYAKLKSKFRVGEGGFICYSSEEELTTKARWRKRVRDLATGEETTTEETEDFTITSGGGEFGVALTGSGFGYEAGEDHVKEAANGTEIRIDQPRFDPIEEVVSEIQIEYDT